MNSLLTSMNGEDNDSGISVIETQMEEANQTFIEGYGEDGIRSVALPTIDYNQRK